MRTLPARRGLAVAVLGALVGAALAATAGSQTWLNGPATVAAPGGRLSGSVLAPLVLAAGLVGLAGAGALLATGGLARRILGVLLVLLAAGAGTTTVSVLAHPTARFAAAAVPGVDAGSHPVTSTAWPVIALLGLLVLAAAGALTVATGRHWSVLGRRYQAPAAAGSHDPRPRTGPAADWDDLDAGLDPTADPDPTAGVPSAAEAGGEGVTVHASTGGPATARSAAATSVPAQPVAAVPDERAALTETEQQQWRSETPTVTPPPGGTAR